MGLVTLQLSHLIATISPQVIGCVRKRWSLPRRLLRSWGTQPERGFRKAEASEDEDFSSSYREGCGEDINVKKSVWTQSVMQMDDNIQVK